MKTLKASPEVEDQEHIFSYLPPEIIHNILSRIAIRTFFTCKCVCKSWLELLESPEFARSHLANSVPGLLIYHLDDTNGTETDAFKIFVFERHERRYKRVLQLKSESTLDDSAPSISEIIGSTDGLLCFQKAVPDRDDYYICNPITHECLRLPKPEAIPGSGAIVAHGFGASRSSNQYKVVVIFLGFVCQVYTLGRRSSWRSVRAPCEEMQIDYSAGRLVNGNLHWLTIEYSTLPRWISRFDIETEVFTKFRPPKLGLEGPPMEIGVLGDRLCAYEFLSPTNEIVIYLMSDNGHGKESWNKEYVIREIPHDGPIRAPVYPLKGFGDGGQLLSLDYVWLLCSSTRTEAVARVDVLSEVVEDDSEEILYTPSFVSLKDFETENAKLSEFVCSMS